MARRSKGPTKGKKKTSKLEFPKRPCEPEPPKRPPEPSPTKPWDTIKGPDPFEWLRRRGKG